MLLIIFLLSFKLVQSESLNVINEFSYDVDHTSPYYAVRALLIGEDTLISCSIDGIWARFENTQPWEKLIDCISDNNYNDFIEDCNNNKQLQYLYSPADIFKEPDSNVIIVFESLGGCLVKLQRNDANTFFAQKWDRGFNNINYNHVCLQNDMFVGTQPYSEEKLLVYGRIGQKDSFKRIFKYPPLLDRKLDSVSINYPISYPAFNPADSTFWLAFRGYDYIYIINKKGKLLDSLPFSSSDYIAPKPPISKLHSQAVYRDWLSKWTPVKVFKYVPPGYFILQFLTGWEIIGVDTIPLHGTQMWTSERKPAELDIDKHWQLAGVQSDGRVIFAHYQVEEGCRKIALHVARIVP